MNTVQVPGFDFCRNLKSNLKSADEQTGLEETRLKVRSNIPFWAVKKLERLTPGKHFYASLIIGHVRDCIHNNYFLQNLQMGRINLSVTWHKAGKA